MGLLRQEWLSITTQSTDPFCALKETLFKRQTPQHVMGMQIWQTQNALIAEAKVFQTRTQRMHIKFVALSFNSMILAIQSLVWLSV